MIPYAVKPALFSIAVIAGAGAGMVEARTQLPRAAPRATARTATARIRNSPSWPGRIQHTLPTSYGPSALHAEKASPDSARHRSPNQVMQLPRRRLGATTSYRGLRRHALTGPQGDQWASENRRLGRCGKARLRSVRSGIDLPLRAATASPRPIHLTVSCAELWPSHARYLPEARPKSIKDALVHMD